MLCGECGASLEPGTRFCPACGSPAADATCTRCGSPLQAAARFCAACGAPVDAPANVAPAAVRERKVATLLFADLVGFTNLGESQDPEVIEALVGRTFDRLSAEVARYEGLVEKFAGDAMLAVFGVPTVHEDDAERAVRAALEMQAAMAELQAQFEDEGRPPLALRIGIETGEVLASRERAAGERDRIVTGDAVNTAARLEQAAASGGVVVGPGTYAATRETIEYEEMEPIALKGKALPVPAWRAVRVRTGRGGRRAVLGLEAPLIGRDEELALLKETVRRTVAEGRPHLVTVLGSAGVGKSRLTWELEKYLDGLPELYHWRKGRCLAYAQTSYSALADALAADASVLDDDPVEQAAAKLSDRLTDLAGGTAPEEVEAAARVMLGQQPAGGLSRDGLFDAWRAYLELIARRAPLVLVLEDIHWADEGLLDFIEFLARWAEAPTMILCLARHELLERRPAWGGGLPNATSIVLEPLGASESEQLIDALLGGSLPAALRRRVVDVTEGNPLFAEELVRLFVDRGVVRHADGRWEQAQPVEAVEIPQSIQALLAARLDSLPADEKRISQDAAVVGRIFWDRILAHLAGQSPATTVGLLRSLRVKELVVPREPSTMTDAQEYAFRHVLIRDVAYESLPKLDRARKHREVATWAEERLGERAEEVVELLAAHYWSALRYQEEFSPEGADLAELRRRTLEYARAAGHRALDVGQHESATQWMRIVMEQSRKIGTPVREHAELAVDYVRVSELYETYEARIVAVTEALDGLAGLGDVSDQDRRLEARLRSQLAYLVYAGSDDVEAARAAVATGLDVLRGIGPCSERASLLHRRGWLAWRAGPVADAIEPLEAAIAEARSAGSGRVERWSLHDLGLALTRGSPDPEGRRMVEESVELARAAGDVPLLMRCYINLPEILLGFGEYQRALAMWEEGLDRARRSMDRHSAFWTASNLAVTYAELGRVADALPLHEEAVAAARAIGLLRGGLPEYAWTLALAGRLDEARRTWQLARETEGAPEPQMIAWWASLDALMSWADDPPQSVARLVDAVADARRAGSVSDTERTARLLVRMALRSNDDDALRLGAGAIGEMATASGSPVNAAHAAWLGSIADADPATGVTAVTRAAEQLEAMEHRLDAADAYADAALLAERAGLPSDDWRAQAARLYAAGSAVPLLDPPG
ncbi:MAG: AAA family ATPase [Candidatus Limnocylindria bacterium]